LGIRFCHGWPATARFIDILSTNLISPRRCACAHLICHGAEQSPSPMTATGFLFWKCATTFRQLSTAAFATHPVYSLHHFPHRLSRRFRQSCAIWTACQPRRLRRTPHLSQFCDKSRPKKSKSLRKDQDASICGAMLPGLCPYRPQQPIHCHHFAPAPVEWHPVRPSQNPVMRLGAGPEHPPLAMVH
jgi:hypothetical protein